MKKYYYISESDYEELLVSYANDYLSYNNLECLYFMDDFDEIMSGSTPTEIAQRIFFGDFNPNHDFFYFNGYANLESTDYHLDYFDSHVDKDNFLEYCDENGYLDSYKPDEDDDEE